MINKVVWKYELRYYMKYKIPGFYKVVHVGEQSGRAYAWVLLNHRVLAYQASALTTSPRQVIRRPQDRSAKQILF